jgi:hypothetical protein
MSPGTGPVMAKYNCLICGEGFDDLDDFTAHVAGHFRDESKASAAQHEPADDRTAQPVGYA